MDNRIYIEKENMAILLFDGNNWNDKTFEIFRMYKAYKYGTFTGYTVIFNSNQNTYFYHFLNVKIVNILGPINIENKDVYVDDKLVNASKVYSFNDGYYRVNIGDKPIITKNLKLRSSKYRDIYEYFIRLSDYAGQISKDTEPLYYLSKNYKKLVKSRNNALYDYFNANIKRLDDKNPILVPYDFNQSQHKAISFALNNNISIIEGPPGTGKTQTILNLIANIIYRGFNCAVVSNNNTAIDNVFEKLSEDGLGFIAARLGSFNNVSNFFEDYNNNELKEFLFNEDIKLTPSYKSQIKGLSETIKKIHEAEIQSALLNSELRDIEVEKKHHDYVHKNKTLIQSSLGSTYYLKVLRRLESPRKLRFFEKFLLNRKLKIKLDKINLVDLILTLEDEFYRVSIIEIQKKLQDVEIILKNKDNINKELKDLSYKIYYTSLKKYYENIKVPKFNKDTYKQDFNSFLLRYPVVISTTQSLINNTSEGFVFDYLIIDEASQCDLLSSVLSMSATKNVVVVGDSRQLEQIDEVRLYDKSEELANELDIPKSYRYENNSILKSIKQSIPKVPTTLLKEHYRCSPDIINFCNKMFYNNELVVMTKNTGTHINVVKTVPGNHARKNPNGTGFYNQREIDEIIEIKNNSNSKSIGVITPFRYQADLIKKECSDKTIEADTIHKFQGRQKDEIILSFVVNTLEKNEESIENRLYDFITNNQLLNVAISRGKNKVTIVVSDGIYNSKNNVISDFIKYAEYLYGSSVIRTSTVTSIFDYLYTNYNLELIRGFKKKPKMYTSELLMCNLINDILNEYKYIGYSMHVRLGKIVNVSDSFTEAEKKYINHPWTHVDYLFYNNISKEKLFVLEVDGIKYHEQSTKQIINDRIKDKVLSENNLPFFRFKTNESNEKERLEKIISEYIY